MATVQELITKYSFEVDTKPLDLVEQKVTGLIGFVAKLGAAGVAAGGSVFGLVKTIADIGDEALASSQKIGLSVENLTRLQFAAKLSNIDAGNLGIGLRFLSRNMNEALKGTSDSAKAFAGLGIQIKDATGALLPTNEVLLQLSDKFRKMPDGAKKTALALEIFGRSGNDLIPMLNEGADGIQRLMDRSDELGATFSTELAKQSDEFTDSLDEMMFSLKGIGKIVAGQLMPVLTPLIKQITQWVVQNKKLVASRVEFFLNTLMTIAKGVYNIFMAIGRAVSGLSVIFGGFENMVTALTAALLVFAGAKILIGIGQVAIAITQLGNAFLIMQAKALALPLAIGAAIAILLLMIEDVFTFFTDPEAETIFGGIVDMFKDFGGVLDETFRKMGIWGQGITNFILMPLRAVMGAFRLLSSVWNADFESVKGWKDFAHDVSGNFNQIVKGGSTLSEAAGFTPTTKEAITSRTERNFMSATPSIVNNINVGDAADPLAIGKSVQIGTKDALDLSMRGAQRSFNKQGAY